MNILYFHTHDSGRYFRHYGHADAPTPFISDWALKEALSFRNAFTACPTCSPSRASLLTGSYPHQNGMLGLAHRGFALNDYSKHLAQFLRRNGYRTVLCGVQHEAAGCFDHAAGAKRIGYAEDLTIDLESPEPDGNNTARWDLENTRRAADWLSRDREEPFFMACGLFSTHREYPDPPDLDPKLVKPMPKLAETSENRSDQARFLKSLSIADRCFRTVMEGLEAGPNAAETLVIFTTDHGPAVPFSKSRLNTEGLGVALSIKLPGPKAAKSFSNALVSTVDIFPTLCELAGLTAPTGLQGKSFVHLFQEREDHQQKDEHREQIFSEMNFHTSYEPMRAVRTRNYSLVRHYDREYPYTHMSNIDDSPAKTLLAVNGLARRPQAPEELFNLEADPLEQQNLIDDPAYADQAEALRTYLEKWQRETGDPLLEGRIQAPAGSIVNTAACLTPDSKNPDDYESR